MNMNLNMITPLNVTCTSKFFCFVWKENESWDVETICLFAENRQLRFGMSDHFTKLAQIFYDKSVLLMSAVRMNIAYCLKPISNADNSRTTKKLACEGSCNIYAASIYTVQSCFRNRSRNRKYKTERKEKQSYRSLFY